MLLLALLLSLFQCLGLTWAAVTFAVVGDWGDDNPLAWPRQQNVADVMDIWCGRQKGGCDFIMATGDNIYPNGPRSAEDFRFDTRWRNVYNGDNIANTTWLITLGNHDHNNDNEGNSLAFGEVEPRWHLPWLWYGETVTDGDTSVLFYSVDTEALKKDAYNNTEQLADLESALAASDAQWKVAFGHHPPLSVGRRWGDSNVLNEVLPVLRRYDVDAFIAGHDHNLQHIVNAGDQDMEYVVSGAGARSKYEYDPENEVVINDLGYESLFFSDNYGFAGVTISGPTMRVEYFTFDARSEEDVLLVPLYSFTRHHAHAHN